MDMQTLPAIYDYASQLIRSLDTGNYGLDMYLSTDDAELDGIITSLGGRSTWDQDCIAKVEEKSMPSPHLGCAMLWDYISSIRGIIYGSIRYLRHSTTIVILKTICALIILQSTTVGATAINIIYLFCSE